MIEFYEVIHQNPTDSIVQHDSYHMTIESAQKRVDAINKEHETRFGFLKPTIKNHKFMDGPNATEFEIPVLANFSNTSPRGVLGKGRIINSGHGSAIFITTNEPFAPEFLEGMVAMSFAWSAANPYLIEHFYRETDV